MSDVRETVIYRVSGEDRASFYSCETKWINQMLKLKEQYPDEVEIKHTNDDGSMLAYFPSSWIRLKPKKKVNLTQEQIEASKERLAQGRMKRVKISGEECDDVDGKEGVQNE